MKLDAFSETLLRLVKEEYRMSDLAIDRFRRLARNGASIEQILLASGLINKKQYFALLEIASGLPVKTRPVKPAALAFFSDAKVQKFRAIPFEKNIGRVHIVFASPLSSHILAVRDIFRKEKLEVIPYIIPEAVFKRSLEMKQRHMVHAIAENMFSEIEKCGLTHFRLVEDESGVHIMTDTFHPITDISLSSEELPAFTLYLQRKAPALGWSIMDEHHGLSKAFHLRREAAGVHPLDWAMDKEIFLQGEGMTVLVQSDPHLEPFVNSIPEFSHFSDWKKNIRKYSVISREDQELAMHAALAGERVVAICADDQAWWSDLSSAGIPVKVLKAEVTPKGRAWEIYRA